jgi:UDP-N-acetylglucosamine 2-epimerase
MLDSGVDGLRRRILVHPRTCARLNELALRPGGERLRLIEPVGYLDMLVLQRNARVVLTTDSAVRIVEILADTVETRAHRR